MVKLYNLYFDDTGSRDPDKATFSGKTRSDGMDCFALGGVIIAAEDIPAVIAAHKVFCERHEIAYPLHSWAIRGGRDDFSWLRNPENARKFFPALDRFMIELPIISVACVIHRPGYVKRYKDRYKDELWFMCRTAFCILAERAAKFAEERGRRLQIYFEQTGKKEDRDIQAYNRLLKSSGPPFSPHTSSGYTPLTAEEFRGILWGKAERRTKEMPMLQLADLVLYPMAKAGYDSSYEPYLSLCHAGKLIDSYLEDNQILLRGIKYSCFDSLP